MQTITQIVNNIFTMTFANRKKELADATWRAHPFFDWLTRKDAVVEKPAGLAIEYPVELGKNTTATTLGRGSTIGISDTEFAKLATYDWKFAAVSVVRYRVDDEKQSRSEHVLIDYVNSKLDNARNSLIELIEQLLMSFGGTVTDPEALNTIIAADPSTGVLGGLDRATYLGWRNKAMTATVPGSTYLTSNLRTLYNEASKGSGGRPDFHLCDQATHEMYEGELLELTRIVNKDINDLGYSGVMYKGSPVEWSEFVPEGTWYMLNTNHLKLCINDVGLLSMTSWKEPVNQAGDSVAQILATFQLTSDNPRKLGVLTGIE